jgi:hypothetical protein
VGDEKPFTPLSVCFLLDGLESPLFMCKGRMRFCKKWCKPKGYVLNHGVLACPSNAMKAGEPRFRLGLALMVPSEGEKYAHKTP